MIGTHINFAVMGRAVLSKMEAKSLPMDLDNITQDLFTAVRVILLCPSTGAS